jgi:hypothetical protein
VRVTGRIKDETYLNGQAQLQLVGSEACTESQCADWLNLPTPLRDGQAP